MHKLGADRAKRITYDVSPAQYAVLVDMAGDMSVQALIDAAVQGHAAQRGMAYPASTRRGATGGGRRKKSA